MTLVVSPFKSCIHIDKPVPVLLIMKYHIFIFRLVAELSKKGTGGTEC